MISKYLIQQLIQKKKIRQRDSLASSKASNKSKEHVFSDSKGFSKATKPPQILQSPHNDSTASFSVDPTQLALAVVGVSEGGEDMIVESGVELWYFHKKPTDWTESIINI